MGTCPKARGIGSPLSDHLNGGTSIGPRHVDSQFAVSAVLLPLLSSRHQLRASCRLDVSSCKRQLEIIWIALGGEQSRLLIGSSIRGSGRGEPASFAGEQTSLF